MLGFHSSFILFEYQTFSVVSTWGRSCRGRKCSKRVRLVRRDASRRVLSSSSGWLVRRRSNVGGVFESGSLRKNVLFSIGDRGPLVNESLVSRRRTPGRVGFAESEPYGALWWFEIEVFLAPVVLVPPSLFCVIFTVEFTDVVKSCRRQHDQNFLTKNHTCLSASLISIIPKGSLSFNAFQHTSGPGCSLLSLACVSPFRAA